MSGFDDFETFDLEDLEDTQAFDMNQKSVLVEEVKETPEETATSKGKGKSKLVAIGISVELLELYKVYTDIRFTAGVERVLSGAILKKLVQYGIHNCRIVDFPKYTYTEKLFFQGTRELTEAFDSANKELFPFSTTITSHHHAYAIQALKMLIKQAKENGDNE
ncbi:hypothetical protein [Vibrio sp. 1CM23M]|uniref:hypothetical protein n=1 Tax=Vibrio sp. 1CM23M TaxID=2929164 RepID=UPI0020C15BAC|nr:hypothetical protein [Vibrio sp. 1CM23M]MCK8072461.1 hypothetical protein [Vibrio sp. 1CM23M]